MLTDRMMYHLKHLQQTLRAAMDEALKQIGLTSAQYGALTALEFMPEASSAARARASFVTAQTMNEIVQALFVSGMVTRQAHPEHGRIVQLSITSEGQKKLTQAHRQVEAIERRMLAGLTTSEQLQLVTWLQQCSRALEVNAE